MSLQCYLTERPWIDQAVGVKPTDTVSSTFYFVERCLQMDMLDTIYFPFTTYTLKIQGVQYLGDFWSRN